MLQGYDECKALRFLVAYLYCLVLEYTRQVKTFGCEALVVSLLIERVKAVVYLVWVVLRHATYAYNYPYDCCQEQSHDTGCRL